MDFLLYGYFGAGNLGDDLLLSVATAELRAIFPTARFFVGDHGHAVPEIRDCVFTKTETILADQTKPRLVRLTLYLAAYSRLFRQCAWFVYAGGTVFHERGTTNVLLLQWLLCLLARLHGVKIAALGVGIADLHSYSGRWLMRRIVGMSRLFLVRDEAALAQCSGTKAGLGDDLVFAWPGAASSHQPRSVDQIRVGLTVYPPACRGAAGAKVTDALAEAVLQLQAHGHKVIFLACQSNGASAGDDEVFAQIATRIGAQANAIETRHLDPDFDTISRQLGDIGVICGMRFHALVLAAMLGRPFAGIAHDNKISEICRRFDMPCHLADELAGTAFAKSIDAIKEQMPDLTKVNEARRLARENFRLFAAAAT